MPVQIKKPVHHKSVSGKRKKLGELLIEAGLVDAETLDSALALQKIQNKRIGQVLVDMGIVDDDALGRTLADQLQIPFVRLEGVSIPLEVLEKVPAGLVEKYSLIPIRITGGKLVVAVANPLELAATDDIQFVTQMPTFVVVSPLGDIREAIERFYPKPDIEKDLEYGIEVPEDLEVIQTREPEETGDQDLLNLADLPPVVRFTNAVIAEGIRVKASDIHIEPRRTHLIVRCRVDGIMHETMRTEKRIHASLVSRLKVLSGLDISVRRKPQDGKSQVNYGGTKFDLRVSTIPTSYGEKVTIRILNPATAQMTPEDLGFSDADLKKLLHAITLPQGILLVTGPTGSGKSSTLYACLNKLNTPEVNIITVEDPVEFDVEGINQVHINPRAGITFAAGLRSILRQDPDIVMVGEIRDAETAAVAFQAAQTGHLVLSTLHTNDAPSAVSRLLDLNVEDFQITSALIGVIAQRLVRKIHPSCKTADTPGPNLLRRIHHLLGEQRPVSLFKGAGCEACLHTGYSGRMGLYEILLASPSLKERIKPGVPVHALRLAAEKEGFQSMVRDGIDKALRGLTTVSEVFRVVPPAEAAAKNRGETSVARPEHTRPRACDVSSSPTGAADSPGLSHEPPTVLVVDDNPEMIALLRQILTSRHYTVLSALDGQTALKIAAAEKPGLVLTDYLMPGMDGMALIQAMKRGKATRRIPIIMLTARDEVESEVAVIDAGADDYLTKPVNAKRLLARVGRFFIQREKILVVDDDAITRKMLRRILEAGQYHVITAGDGKRALSALAGGKPDLVITDYQMPEMDGMALIRELRKNDATRRIPIIMLTAQDEVESEVAVIDAGADDYLTKPVNAKRLLSRVKRFFRESGQPGYSDAP